MKGFKIKLASLITALTFYCGDSSDGLWSAKRRYGCDCGAGLRG